MVFLGTVWVGIDKVRLGGLTLLGLRESSACLRALWNTGDMLFNVSSLLTGSVGDEIRFHFADETVGNEGIEFRNVEARGRLMRTDRTVFADLKVKAECETDCSRCLIETVAPLSLDFTEEFRPENTDLMASHRDWFEDFGTDLVDDALTIDSGNVLDISIALWQALCAAMPMNPLCDPDCKGMCTDCSADLNRQKCACVFTSNLLEIS